MPKVKIERRSAYPFATELTVRVGDLNYGAHLAYDRILGLAHQARLVLFEQLGVTETDLGDGSTGIVASDLAVNYQGEGFLNDLLKFEILPVEVGPISFRLAHRVTGAKDGRAIALIEIGFVAFNYEKRALARIPEGFAEALGELGQG